jgi:hypothetical protein
VIILDEWVWLSERYIRFFKVLVEHDCVINCEATRFAIIVKQMPKKCITKKRRMNETEDLLTNLMSLERQ